MVVVAVLWRIWRSQNWVVLEGKQFGIPVLLCQFHQQYQEWVRLPVDLCLRAAPPLGVLGNANLSHSITCMWDGLTSSGSHSAGGIVIKDFTGHVLLVRGVQFPGMDDPMVAELLVLREAVCWCLELGFLETCFQGDA
ncbi:unnamed protein product [Linum trigynum]|uniref:RNase H type-1 domain-containing protein n=1 Tax=Linum trigynum TaxID=586398 RepID=A0AAV2FVB7_9ROSI